jgi:hypothetical protein
VVFIGGWLGYEMAGFVFGDNLFSLHWYGASSFAGSMWFMPFFSTYGASFGPLEVGYRATRVFDSGWIEYFGGQGLYWVLLILVGLVSFEENPPLSLKGMTVRKDSSWAKVRYVSAWKIIYHAFFHLAMNYGIIFWGNLLHSSPIFCIKKCNYNYGRMCERVSCRKLLKKLKILPLTSQYLLY